MALMKASGLLDDDAHRQILVDEVAQFVGQDGFNFVDPKSVNESIT